MRRPIGNTIYGSALLRTACALGVGATVLTGCQTLDGMKSAFDSSPNAATETAQHAISANLKLSKFIPLDKLDTEPRMLAAKGLKALEADRIGDASDAFNQALKLDITNSYLQFLNGYAYHLMGDLDDTSKYTLALEG